MPNALRPLTVGELLDRTFFLYRRHFAMFVGIAALPNLILLAFQLTQIVISGAVTSLVSMLATLVVYFMTIAVSQGATIIAVSQIQLDRETSVTEAFGAIRSRIYDLAGIIFGMGIRILIGFILLIVPGVYLAIVWSLAIPVAVLEGRNLSESLQRSAELTKGHRGRILVVYFLLLVLVYIVTLLLEVPTMAAVAVWGGGLRGGDVPAWGSIVIALSNFITTSIVGPIVTIALSLIYYDERVRKEAFDLQHMMQEIDQAAAPSPAT
jgi:hypothetical protein